MEARTPLVKGEGCIQGGTRSLRLGWKSCLGEDRGKWGDEIAKIGQAGVPCLGAHQGHRDVNGGMAKPHPEMTGIAALILEQLTEALQLIGPASAANKAVVKAF